MPVCPLPVPLLNGRSQVPLVLNRLTQNRYVGRTNLGGLSPQFPPTRILPSGCSAAEITSRSTLLGSDTLNVPLPVPLGPIKVGSSVPSALSRARHIAAPLQVRPTRTILPSACTNTDLASPLKKLVAMMVLPTPPANVVSSRPAVCACASVNNSAPATRQTSERSHRSALRCV